jgi:hypothetical protein
MFGLAIGSQSLEGVQGEHDLDGHVEVGCDAKSQVQRRAVLPALELADGLVVDAGSFGLIPPQNATFCAGHRQPVVDDIAGFPHGL